MTLGLVVLFLQLGACQPREIAEQIQRTNQKAYVLVTDPNGPVQQTADAEDNSTDTASEVVSVLPIPSPWKVGALGVLAITGALVGAVQKWKRTKSERALTEVVVGTEAAKKAGGISAESFKTAQQAAQSVETTRMVARIRKEVA